MKIFHEKLDGEYWIDQILTEKELKLLQDGQMLHKSFCFNGLVYNLGININTEEDKHEEDRWEEENF